MRGRCVFTGKSRVRQNVSADKVGTCKKRECGGECDGCDDEEECQGVTFKLQDRSLHIHGFIGEETIFKVKSSLDACIKGPKARLPVHVFINTSGGLACAALALYDLFKNAPFPVHTYCLAECYSAGLIIFLGGTVRLMYPNSYLVFHEATFHNFVESTFQERTAKKHVNHMQKFNERVLSLLIKNSALDKETLTSYLYSEHMMFAEEAVAAGLATKIFQKKSRKKS